MVRWGLHFGGGDSVTMVTVAWGDVGTWRGAWGLLPTPSFPMGLGEFWAVGAADSYWQLELSRAPGSGLSSMERRERSRECLAVCPPHQLSN